MTTFTDPQIEAIMEGLEALYWLKERQFKSDDKIVLITNYPELPQLKNLREDTGIMCINSDIWIATVFFMQDGAPWRKALNGMTDKAEAISWLIDAKVPPNRPRPESINAIMATFRELCIALYKT